MSDPDPAATYERLRTETAEMLRLNADSASLIEGLQVDLVALLRLEIDTLQGAVLSGDSVDLARLASALTMLRSLLPEKALVSAPPPVETRFGPDHRARLKALIEKTLLGGEKIVDESREALERQFRDHDAREREERLCKQPDEARAALEAEIAAARAKHGADPAGGDVRDSDVSSLPSPSPAAGGAPAHPAAPPPREHVPVLPPTRPVEEWRRWVDENGIRSSPWSSRW
jgi:hypothetical protein